MSSGFNQEMGLLISYSQETLELETERYTVDVLGSVGGKKVDIVSM